MRTIHPLSPLLIALPLIVGCLDAGSLSKTPEARKVFIEGFNSKAPDGCHLESAGDLTRVTYACQRSDLERQRSDVLISCQTYHSFGFERVTITAGKEEMHCDISSSCQCKKVKRSPPATGA